jgi:hypothetical protein
MSNNKSKTHDKGKTHADRGTVWVIWLVLLGLHGVGAILLAYTTLSAEYAQNRNLIITSLVIAAVLQVVSVIGMWFWKTWGLYLYVAVTFIQMAAHMVLTATVWVGFYDAIPLLITGYILNYKKLLKNFS